MASHPGSQEDYANVFARLYPEFCPTQALYLDMERDLYGRVLGLAAYWPQDEGPARFLFKHLSPGDGDRLPPDTFAQVNSMVHERRDPLTSVAVFSGRDGSQPKEQTWFEEWLGYQPFDDVPWVNFHEPLVKTCLDREKGAGITRKAIETCGCVRKLPRQNGVEPDAQKPQKPQKQLEALECEFEIHRPREIRSAGNEYADGSTGTIKPLDLAREIGRNQNVHRNIELLSRYCRYDVESLFKIAEKCNNITSATRP